MVAVVVSVNSGGSGSGKQFLMVKT
jgi:hypothetical protein